MPTGTELAQAIRAAQTELQAACKTVGDDTADRAPEGRWCPREILSHIAGAGEVGIVPFFRRFLDEDTPRIDVVPEQTNLTDVRRAMPFAQLAAMVAQRYEELARFAETLSAEQLARTAHVPALAKSPLGERPTLGGLLGGFGQYHVKMHTDHLREVLAGIPAK